MAFFTATSADYKDLITDLRTNALANGWQEGTGVNGGRYDQGVIRANEDEWIATGTGAGADAITCGIRTYSDEQNQYFNWELAGMDSYTDANTWETQPGISDGRYDGAGNAAYGSYVPLDNRTMTYWWSVTSSRMTGVIRVGATYVSFYLGWGMRLDTVGNYADPKVVAGTMALPTLRYNADHVLISGIINPIAGDNPAAQSGPVQIHNRAGAWESYSNSERANTTTNVQRDVTSDRVLFPMGRPYAAGPPVTGADSWISGTVSGDFAPAPENIIPMASSATDWPGSQGIMLRRTPDPTANEDTVKRIPVIAHRLTQLDLELDGVFWISAAGGPNDPPLQPEDRIQDPVSLTFYRVFPMGAHNSDWNYLCLEEV